MEVFEYLPLGRNQNFVGSLCTYFKPLLIMFVSDNLGWEGRGKAPQSYSVLFLLVRSGLKERATFSGKVS
jgi:hypothetical protein